MLEIGTSGSVRGEDGNILTYSAVGLAQRREVGSERVRVLERGEVGQKLQLTGTVHGFDTLQEQAPEQAREHADRKKEANLAGYPTRAVRR
jgi:hypothetical protein